MERVGFDADSDSDDSILITHGDTDNAVRIYADGRNGDVNGAITWSAHNDGDRLYLDNMRLLGGIVMGATAVASNVRLRDCVVKHEGVTGGHSSTVVVAMSCFSLTGSTFAALDGDDIAGSITGELVLA